MSDAVYRERTAVVAMLAGMAMELGFEAGLGEHPPDPTWDPDWMTILFVDLPDGNGGAFQASWHIAKSDLDLVAHLPRYSRPWDGHTTEQKYERMLAAAALLGHGGGA